MTSIIRNTPEEKGHANGRAEQFTRAVISLARNTPGEICVVFQIKIRGDGTFDYVWDWFWRLPTENEEKESGIISGYGTEGSGDSGVRPGETGRHAVPGDRPGAVPEDDGPGEVRDGADGAEPDSEPG